LEIAVLPSSGSSQKLNSIKNIANACFPCIDLKAKARKQKLRNWPLQRGQPATVSRNNEEIVNITAIMAAT